MWSVAPCPPASSCRSSTTLLVSAEVLDQLSPAIGFITRLLDGVPRSAGADGAGHLAQRVGAVALATVPLEALRRDARARLAAVEEALGLARLVSVEQHSRVPVEAVNLQVLAQYDQRRVMTSTRGETGGDRG